jgi:hypothetical protein
LETRTKADKPDDDPISDTFRIPEGFVHRSQSVTNVLARVRKKYP